MEGQLRVLVVIGLTGLLILLRLDAARFGTAEYDDELAPGGWRSSLQRLGWYATGIALAAVIYQIHPSPGASLHLSIGEDRVGAILIGLLFGAVGTAAAAGLAWYRYRRLRLPEYRHYAGGALNAIGTAAIDEVAFRGALLGLTIAMDWPVDVAIAFQAILYALATRLGAPGRSHVMLLVSLGVGVVAGVLTVTTGGIGAGLLGHAVIRFAVFVTTGHAGQVRPVGHEPEEEAQERLPPEGWEVVSEGDG